MHSTIKSKTLKGGSMKSVLIVLLMFSWISLFCSDPYTPKVSFSYLDTIPEFCPNPEDSIMNPTIPAGFSSVVPWMQAVHNPRLGSTSHIEVDYLRLYSIDKTLLASNDYNSWNPTKDGGLYTKHNHWFAFDNHDPMPAAISNGALSFYPSDVDSVWHWWTDRITTPSSLQSIYVEARVRISGGGCVQLGADWWLNVDAPYAGNGINNKPVGVTRWYFASSDWQIISLSIK
jgi:hypothetical protein